MHKGKKYQAALERFDREELYPPADAVAFVKDMAFGNRADGPGGGLRRR